MATTRPQTATPRSTEGPKGTGAVAGKSQGRGRGRPPGSPNKPKSLIPAELANEMLAAMRTQLPPEHYAYIKGVIKDGKVISTKQELQTLILLLNRNLWPALLAESQGEQEIELDDDGTVKGTSNKVVFRKDLTERLKVLQGLLNLLNQIEKRDEGDKDGQEPLIRIYADRGIDRSRLAVLVGVQPSLPAGDSDGVGWGADGPRVVSDSVPERPIGLPSGEQVEADRV